MHFPDSLAGWCHLGLDSLQRNHFTSAERFAIETDSEALGFEPQLNSAASLFPGLDSRLTSLVTGGRTAIAPINSATHRRDHRRLSGRTQSSACQLLEALAIAASAPLAGSHNTTVPHRMAATLAAADQYCAAARASHQHDRWRALVNNSAIQ
jgi:hypothetical protein